MRKIKFAVGKALILSRKKQTMKLMKRKRSIRIEFLVKVYHLKSMISLTEGISK